MLPRMATRRTHFLLLAVLALASAGCTHRRLPPPSPPPVSSAAPAPAVEKKEGAPYVPAGWRPYVVRPGDTLTRIADCRGVLTVTLARVNALADPDRIAAGALLYVPPYDACAAAKARRSPRPKPLATEGSAPEQRTALEPPPAPHLRAELERGEELLAKARSRYDAAEFDAALDGAQDAAAAFARAGGSPGATPQRARAHVLAAMAAAGLEEHERAVAEFQRAFALDPGVTVDPEDRSPRLEELMQRARASRAGR